MPLSRPLSPPPSRTAGPPARRHWLHAGGPKGLILGALDRFIFGEWLAQSRQEIGLVGASIGAWRMATACLHHPGAAFLQFEHDYIRQHYEFGPGNRLPPAQRVSALFAQSLRAFYEGCVFEVLNHSRYRLHVITARGRHVLCHEHGLLTPLGYAGAFVANALQRKAMGAWLERVVFSTDRGAPAGSPTAALPFGADDYPTRQLRLEEANFCPALQASCSIPFALAAVHDIPGAPPGTYWYGGTTDYQLHLNYATMSSAPAPRRLVPYPHYQQAIVPRWLDKALRWRHHATPFLDITLVLAPNPEWVKTLPNGNLPDRKDFTHHGNDVAGRVKAWTAAGQMSRQLADEFQAWLARPNP